VICNVDNLSIKNSYLLGTVQAIQTPTILLSQDDNSPLVDWVPSEFQRRVIPKKDIEGGLKIIESQIELFEEDFIELDKDKKVTNYINSLSLSAASKGEYTNSIRDQIIEITMGNKIGNVTGSTVVVDSNVSNSFNTIASKYDEETAQAFNLLAEEVRKSKNAAASTLLTGLTEEAQKEKPEKGKLKQFWDGLVAMLPGVTSMVGITEKIIKLFI
jgi:archaellum component FlaC